MKKYDIKIDKFDTRIEVYTLTNNRMPEKIKIDLYLSNNQWRVNWGAYGDQNIEFTNEFMAVMGKAIEMMEELNAGILDKALDEIEL